MQKKEKSMGVTGKRQKNENCDALAQEGTKKASEEKFGTEFW